MGGMGMELGAQASCLRVSSPHVSKGHFPLRYHRSKKASSLDEAFYLCLAPQL